MRYGRRLRDFIILLASVPMVGLGMGCGSSADERGGSTIPTGGAGGMGTGGSGNSGSGAFSCSSVYGDECGKACEDDEGCAAGLHCNAERCTAVCSSAAHCESGAECTGSGRCALGIGGPGDCEPLSCAERGWACGRFTNECGNISDCADEGLGCGDGQNCIGGIDGPTECVDAGLADCDVCSAIPDCSDQPQTTIITGRVVTPGRDDDDTENQLGVPNAVVYVLRSNQVSDLPEIPKGLPPGDAVSCDRCEDQDLGPVLIGTVTDSTGSYTLEGKIPVGVEFLLVVKAGKFRRAVAFSVDPEDACTTVDRSNVTLPNNPTRLPRDLDDGLAVNVPHIAITTGDYDAMECVFEKIGLAHSLFTSPTGDGPIHLYRDNGAWPSGELRGCVGCAACTGNNCRRSFCDGCGDCEGGTECSACQATVVAACEASGIPTSTELVGSEVLHQDGGRITEYDMVVSNCRGNANGAPDAESDDAGNVRRYVNRGGRFFASHFSHNWIQHGTEGFSADAPLDTGLAPAVVWQGHDTGITNGTGILSENPPRENASPRIQSFIDWMVHVDAVSEDDLSFNIPEPRSRATTLGEFTEEFVHCEGGVCDRESRWRPQQIAFNTPYAAPSEGAACGRVVYSGFHVSVTGTSDLVFPSYCSGPLSPPEKTLLFLLFDLGACVGEDPPVIPPCVPQTCEDAGARCGIVLDGCGDILDCGICPPPH
jgi:hypothetical protein